MPASTATRRSSRPARPRRDAHGDSGDSPPCTTRWLPGVAALAPLAGDCAQGRVGGVQQLVVTAHPAGDLMTEVVPVRENGVHSERRPYTDRTRMVHRPDLAGTRDALRFQGSRD
jgi:hypothetical protein